MMRTALEFAFFLSVVSGLSGQGTQNDKNSFAFAGKAEKIYIAEKEKSLFEKRLELINSKNTIKIGIHDAIPEQIKRFLGFRRIPKTMGLAEFYFYMFEKKLEKYGLPEELKYLPVIESNLNPKARSKAGAMGLWQFLPATGKQFGLSINSSVSLYYDPIASTDAACRYLKYLHDKFGDWELALAAYNCGEGRLERIIKKIGKKDYWEIRDYLPKETRNYVPSFLAIQYLFNFYDEHNLVPQRLLLDYSNIEIKRATEVLSVLDFEGEQREKQIFIFLNPHILTDRISKGTVYYTYEPQKTK